MNQKGDESHMKQTAMLTTASLLTILLMTFHLAGDILFKMAPAGLSNLFSDAVFFVWILLALGITTTFSFILSARALLSLPWRRSRRASTSA